MSFETALARRLLDSETIAADVGTRVDWLRRPGDVLPAITLQTVTDPRPQHYRGFQLRRTGVQLDVWAQTPAIAFALREKVIAQLAPAATVQGVTFQRASDIAPRSGFEQEEAGGPQQPQGELYRETIDILFTHNG